MLLVSFNYSYSFSSEFNTKTTATTIVAAFGKYQCQNWGTLAIILQIQSWLLRSGKRRQGAGCSSTLHDMKASMQSATSAIDMLHYCIWQASTGAWRPLGRWGSEWVLVKMCIETINLRLVTFLPRTPRTLLVLVVWLFAFFKMSSIYPWAGNR